MFFEIDVLDLQTKSGKPKYLAARPKSTSHGHAERRNEFLESRRMKLVKRAAQIKESVAARMAVIEATAQAKRGVIDKSIEAVTNNRKSIIEAQVEANASIVSHAKEVARSRATKREHERATRQASLHHRMQITALRRQRLLTVPRSRLLEPDSQALQESTSLQYDASMTIQSWWRRNKLAPAAKAYLKTNLTMETAKNMPFERLMRMMQNNNMIKAVGRLLIRAKKLNATPITHWKNPSRVFLSAYMVVGHPAEMMLNAGPQEEDLKLLAEKMLLDFEVWLAGASSDTVFLLGKSFLASYQTYYEAFEAWKSNDTVKIVEDLVSQYFDLERLWMSVMDQEDAENEWKPRIDEQQAQVKARLAKFGPQALDKLAAAQSKFEFEKQTLSSRSSARRQRSNTTDSVSRSGSATPVASEPVALSQTENAPEIPDEFGKVFSNEQIAHEMVMDPEFSLKPQEKSEFEKQVEAIAKKAFFDAIQEEINAGNYGNHVIGILRDIKQNLLAMVSEEGKFAVEINEVMDLELIQQQINNKAFDLHRSLEYVGSKMLQLCAPMRDASIRAVSQEENMASALQKILEILEEMRIDLANFRLQALKPHLSKQAVEYERTKFDAALEMGLISLDKTKNWLKTSVETLEAVSATRNPESIAHPDLRVKYENAFHFALLTLIFGSTTVSVDSVPETLSMDANRLFGFQNEAQALTIISALVMLTKNIVPDIRTDDKALKNLTELVSTLLQAADTNVEKLSSEIISFVNGTFVAKSALIQDLAKQAGKAAPELKIKTLTEEQEGMVRNMVDKTLSFKDPVFMLLSRRIQAVIRQHMERGSFKNESLASHGLTYVGTELERLSGRIAALSKHNKEVYAKHYDNILKDFIA